MERGGPAGAFIQPATPAQIAMHTDLAWQVRTRREVRKDHGKVVLFRNDRVGLIRWTLTEIAGVDMYIGDNTQPAYPADCPKLAQLPAVDHDNAGRERPG